MFRLCIFQNKSKSVVLRIFQLQQQNKLKILPFSYYFFYRLFFYPLPSAKGFLADLSE